MAYFPNGSAGECFVEQCLRCVYGEETCPIALVQMLYNYKAVNNQAATEILNLLVSHDGTCAMFEMDKNHFERNDSNLELFPK